MIDLLYVKNFKQYESESVPFGKNNIIIGENDSGKSTILEALDIFFNHEKIPNLKLVRDLENDVEIGVLIAGKFYKKVYTGKTKKESFETEDFNDFPNLTYIFLDAGTTDIQKLISDLCSAKTTEVIDEGDIQLFNQKAQDAASSILETISDELLVFDKNVTNISVEPQIKLQSAIKFDVSSDGVPLEGRGSGFRKNLAYALLTKSSYDNVILGIDEIENSLSVLNAQSLIRKAVDLFPQTIATTHSPKIVEVSENHTIIARFHEDVKTLSKLYSVLDPTNTKYYLLVEGKFDIPWIKSALQFISSPQMPIFVVLPSGGSNVDVLAQELEQDGKSVIMIKDGDIKDDLSSLTRDVIEMYTPLKTLNDIFDLSLEEYPQTKEDFFSVTKSETRSSKTVKSILAKKCDSFIDEDNPLVEDLKRLIERRLT